MFHPVTPHELGFDLICLTTNPSSIHRAPQRPQMSVSALEVAQKPKGGFFASEPNTHQHPPVSPPSSHQHPPVSPPSSKLQHPPVSPDAEDPTTQKSPQPNASLPGSSRRFFDHDRVFGQPGDIGQITIIIHHIGVPRVFPQDFKGIYNYTSTCGGIICSRCSVRKGQF